ncbi:hypothetical protein BO71DRAFT_283287, partial [Aspergillus ellipticus CBS 707.79]
DYPTILFLDPSLLQHGQIETTRAALSIPPHIQNLLGDFDEIHLTADRFFNHIHQWMPFISKKRFYDLHLRPSYHSQPDVVLLLLALKLITSFPPTGGTPRTALYNAVKHFYVEVENSTVFSILVLQAGVLVALYELGHGIYPAAFLSIGGCARYAHALGINVNRVPVRKAVTLVEVEERRRIWWAIVILDRFVSIGCPGRPLATVDPRLDDLLPADDTAWDQGVVRPDELSTLSSPMSGHMSKFALLCQAARLLGQVLHHLSNDSTDDVWMQLDRTLQSMLTAALDIDCPDYDQITFIYSSLVALYTLWLFPNRDPRFERHRDRAHRAKAILQQITDRINANLVERQCFLGRDPEDMSPWGLYFAYRVCGAHMRSTKRNPHATEVVRSLREGLQTIDVRWRVAGVYLQLLEAQEAL